MNRAKYLAMQARANRMSAENDGRITRSQIVEDARSETSPFHDYFEWDDTIAGHKFRLVQAGILIRTVLRVEVETSAGVERHVRFVRDPEAGSDEGYLDLSVVKKSHSLKRATLLAEIKRVNGAFNRALDVADELDMREEFEAMRAHLETFHERLETAA